MRSFVAPGMNKMVSTKFLNIVTAIVLCQLFPGAVAQRCEGGSSITGKMLKGFTYKKTKVESPLECLHSCNDDDAC